MLHTEPPLTHRQIWLLAGPMILANLSTPLLGLVDTAVVGHLSSPIYLGAVALGTMLFSFLFWGFGFLRMVTTGLTAQANGRMSGQTEAVLQQSVTLALLIAAVLLLLQTPIGWLAFTLVDGSEAVREQAGIYYQIRIWSAPATLVNYAVLGWLIGMGAARSALLIVLVINLSNIAFDLLLVYQFGMKTDGVALASVMAEYTGLLFGLTLLFRRRVILRIAQLLLQVQSLRGRTQGLDLHGNFMLRTLCLIFSFAFFTNQGAKQGDVVLAANMLLLNFITLAAYVLDGFANSTEVMSGQAIGRGDSARLRRALWLNGLWSVLAALLFSLVYALLGQPLIGLLSDIEAVRESALVYLPWLVLAPLLGVWSYLFDGLFVGATRGREMRNTMLMATFVFYLPAWYLLQGWGNHGLWAALLIFLAARGGVQAAYVPRIMRSL